MKYILLLQLFGFAAMVRAYGDLSTLQSHELPTTISSVTDVIYLDRDGKPLCPRGGERVCATDGDNYIPFENHCTLEAHNFKLLMSGKPELIVTENVHCSGTNCASLTCPRIYQPVCAAPEDSTQGTTISNSCEVNRQACLTNKPWRVLNEGPCSDSSSTACPQFCTMEYNPVCAEHNYVVKTFGNECVLRTAICSSGTPWKFMYRGECKYQQVSYVVRPNVNPNPYAVHQGARYSIPPSPYGPNYYQSPPQIPYYPQPYAYGAGISHPNYDGQIYGSPSLYDSPCILGNWPVCAAWYGRKRTFATACEVLRTNEPWKVIAMGPCPVQSAPARNGTNNNYGNYKVVVQYNTTRNNTYQPNVYGQKYITATPMPNNTSSYNTSVPYTNTTYVKTNTYYKAPYQNNTGSYNTSTPYVKTNSYYKTPYQNNTNSYNTSTSYVKTNSYYKAPYQKPYYVTTSTTEEPTTTESSSTDPSTTESSSTEPSTTESSSTEPSTTESSSTEPSTTESSSTEPSTTESSSTEPSTTESSSTEESSTTESSTEESSTTEANATETSDTVVFQSIQRASFRFVLPGPTAESATDSTTDSSTESTTEITESTTSESITPEPVYPAPIYSAPTDGYPANSKPTNTSQSNSTYPTTQNSYKQPIPYNKPCEGSTQAPPTSVYKVLSKVYSPSPAVYQSPSFYTTPPRYIPPSPPMQIPYPQPYPMFYPPPPPPSYPYYYGQYPSPSPYAGYPNNYAPSPYPIPPSPYSPISYPYPNPTQNTYTNYLIEKLESLKSSYEGCLYNKNV